MPTTTGDEGGQPLSFTLEQLRGVSDKELIRLHDQLAETTLPGVNYYLEELRRRESSRQTEQIASMTKTMKRLTWAIAFLTLANVIVAAKAVW